MNRLNVTINITSLSEKGQKAHAYYGFRFTRTDACVYFIRGALEATVRKV